MTKGKGKTEKPVEKNVKEPVEKKVEETTAENNKDEKKKEAVKLVDYPFIFDLPASQEKVSILRRATAFDVLKARRSARTANPAVNVFAEEEYLPHIIAGCVEFPESTPKNKTALEILKMPAMDVTTLEDLVLGGVQLSSQTKS